MKKNSKKSNTSVGCLFWIALILLVLIVGLFNRERIRTVIEETGFDELITREEPDQQPEVKRTAPEEEEEAPEEPRAVQEPGEQQPSAEQKEGEEQPAEEEEPADEITIDDEEAEDQEGQEGEQAPRIDKKMRKSPLYFVSVAEDGSISLRKIVRPVYYESSPLTQTLRTLLKGLTSSELNEGLLNLIPEETALRRVWVEDGVAYIDFSEQLKFNPFGTEGLRASLRQIIYTATEFNTVDKVQILIEGETQSYLSTEGVFIGEPLGRDDI
jgi:spore germination protein GerM